MTANEIFKMIHDYFEQNAEDVPMYGICYAAMQLYKEQGKITGSEYLIVSAFITSDVRQWNRIRGHVNKKGEPFGYFHFESDFKRKRLEYLKSKINGTFDYKTFNP